MAGSLKPQTHPLAFTADHARLGALSVLLMNFCKSPSYLLFFCILSVFISGSLSISYVSLFQSPYCFWKEIFKRMQDKQCISVPLALPSAWPTFTSLHFLTFRCIFLLGTWVINEFIHGASVWYILWAFFLLSYTNILDFRTQRASIKTKLSVADCLMSGLFFSSPSCDDALCEGRDRFSHFSGF